MNRQELLEWAKSHIKDLRIDNDRLYYVEGNKVLIVTFANKHKLEITNENGIEYVRIQEPREGIEGLIFSLNKSLELGE
ncbi:MAG: hypothetical protein QXE01_11920 [Sulfolobales archaeon]